MSAITLASSLMAEVERVFREIDAMDVYHAHLMDSEDIRPENLVGFWAKVWEEAHDMRDSFLEKLERRLEADAAEEAVENAAHTAYLAKQKAFKEAAEATEDKLAFWTEAFAGAKTVSERCDIFFTSMDMPAEFAAAPDLRALLKAQMNAAYADAEFIHSALSVLEDIRVFLGYTLPEQAGYTA